MTRRLLPLLVLAGCTPNAPQTIEDCHGADRDQCLSNLAVTLIARDPDAGVAALNAIQDPVARLAAGGAIFASRDMVFDFATSTKICAALHDSFDEGFCQRRLGQGHLRRTSQ